MGGPTYNYTTDGILTMLKWCFMMFPLTSPISPLEFHFQTLMDLMDLMDPATGRCIPKNCPDLVDGHHVPTKNSWFLMFSKTFINILGFQKKNVWKNMILTMGDCQFSHLKWHHLVNRTHAESFKFHSMGCQRGTWTNNTIQDVNPGGFRILVGGWWLIMVNCG